MVRLGPERRSFDPLGQIEIGDKGAHQPGFAHAGGQGKAEGGNFVQSQCRWGRQLLPFPTRQQISVLLQVEFIRKFRQDFQALSLGRAQT